ncbi:hypothetical protein IAI10_18060 [Clostridium sp. 19966]|uniref:hypothetical protein n=1 Tax=Clostridium sp. 19966 TaxID=2768166 RepID=UPI0028E008F5|nr:hypothetical protein [Clostridium sp. 19966]MDT8718573.1 hypothetical protein [Clostridium sp. 19966]
MKANKILSVLIVVTIVAAVSTGCGKKDSTNKASGTTAVQKTEKEKPTKEEFLEQSKKIMKDMEKVCDKYGVKYDNDDSIGQDSEQKGSGYFFDTEEEKVKLSDGSDNSYEVIKFGGTVSNDGSTGQKVINISVRQKDYKTQFDVNTCNLLKDMIIAITGDSNYDFGKLNQIVKTAQDKELKDVVSNEESTIGDYKQNIQVILGEGTNTKMLAYKLYTGKVELKK